jgi:hypothetical protein
MVYRTIAMPGMRVLFEEGLNAFPARPTRRLGPLCIGKLWSEILNDAVKGGAPKMISHHGMRT